MSKVSLANLRAAKEIVEEKTPTRKNVPAKPKELAARSTKKSKEAAPVEEAAPARTRKGKAAEVVAEVATEGQRGRPGYGERGYKLLIKENPCRPGYCGDQVDCLLSSKTIAEAQRKLRELRPDKRLEVAWAVSRGFIALAD